MAAKRHFTTEEARRIGEVVGADWTKIPLGKLCTGSEITHDPVLV